MMNINKNDFLKAHNFAWEALDYANSEQELIIDNKVTDLNTTLFACSTYPFDMSFDELVWKIETITEDGLEHLNEDELNLIHRYINYVFTTLNDSFKFCKANELQKIYFAQLSIFNKTNNSGIISEYAVNKETAKRVYYYSILDDDTCNEDILSVSKQSFETSDITLGSVCTASIWCYEKDTKSILKKLENDLKSALIEKLNKVDNYTTREKSYIKI